MVLSDHRSICIGLVSGSRYSEAQPGNLSVPASGLSDSLELRVLADRLDGGIS